MISKMDIYNMIPVQFIPKTLFVEKGASPELALERILDMDISFPFIAKPDIGMKAFGVEKSIIKMSFGSMCIGVLPIFGAGINSVSKRGRYILCAKAWGKPR